MFDVTGADGSTVRMNASIIWDGITASVPYIDLPALGQILGTLINGQVFKADGSISVEVIGGQLRTVVTGDFLIGTLKANGSAIIGTSGTSVTLELDADLAGRRVRRGASRGAVIITDGLAETIVLDAVGQRARSTWATCHARRARTCTSRASTAVRSTCPSPDGSWSEPTPSSTPRSKAPFGPNGTLLSLDGQVNGSVQLDDMGRRELHRHGGRQPRAGHADRLGHSLDDQPPAGDHVQRHDHVEADRTRPGSSTASGSFRIASINMATARLSLSQAAGMKATRVGFYFSILGIPTYFEGDFFLKPSGGCSKVDITAGGLIAKAILAGVLPGVIGCPVNV